MLFMLLHEYYISCESCSEGEGGGGGSSDGVSYFGSVRINLGPKIPYITQTVQCRHTFMNREILKMFLKSSQVIILV